MGSFGEAVLSFEFRVDVPDEVLAAFSALAQPSPEDAYRGPAPVLLKIGISDFGGADAAHATLGGVPVAPTLLASTRLR